MITVRRGGKRSRVLVWGITMQMDAGGGNLRGMDYATPSQRGYAAVVLPIGQSTLWEAGQGLQHASVIRMCTSSLCGRSRR
jgi:hypothetical protein